MTTAMTTLEARVARGAAVLDELRPSWWRRVDLDELSLTSDYRCVLAQAYNTSYGRALFVVTFGDSDDASLDRWAVEHGFHWRWRATWLPCAGLLARWRSRALERRWREVIAARRLAARRAAPAARWERVLAEVSA